MHGYHYVNTGLNTDLECHHDLIWKLGLHHGLESNQKNISIHTDRILQKLNAEHKQHNDKHLIISSELLAFLDDFRKLKPILAVFDNRDIKFIACLRRQDTFLESLYQQVVKDGISDTFQTWYPKAKKISNYNLLIANLLQITKKENIVINTFNSKKNGFNPTAEFLVSAGLLHTETNLIQNDFHNKRLPSACINIIRLSNYLNLKINHKLVRLFSKCRGAFPRLKNRGKYLSNSQRTIIRREHNASNKALTEQLKLPPHIEKEILSW